MKNKCLIVLTIVLSMLVAILSGYIIYDKVLNDTNWQNNINNKIENEKNIINKNPQNNNSEFNQKKYLSEDFSGTVFQFFDPNKQLAYYLTLWPDGRYMYTNESRINETLGEYSVENDKIKLTYKYMIERGNNLSDNNDDYATKVTSNIAKELTIKSLSELKDEENDIILIKINQPSNSGDKNYNTILENLMN